MVHLPRCTEECWSIFASIQLWCNKKNMSVIIKLLWHCNCFFHKMSFNKMYLAIELSLALERQPGLRIFFELFCFKNKINSKKIISPFAHRLQRNCLHQMAINHVSWIFVNFIIFFIRVFRIKVHKQKLTSSAFSWNSHAF